MEWDFLFVLEMGSQGRHQPPSFLLCLRKASSNTTPALASLSHDTDPGRRHTGLPGLRQGWPACKAQGQGRCCPQSPTVSPG